MGKRGPRPEPTAVKIYKGNPGKRDLNLNEPKPTKDNIKAPDHLDGEALEKWNRVVPVLKSMGLMTDADVDTIARYCCLHQQFYIYLEKVKKYGGTIQYHNPDGSLKRSSPTPESAELHKLATALLRIEQEYGLTASARSGIDMKKIADDSLDSFISETG